MLGVFPVRFISVCTMCSVFKLWQVQRVWPHHGHGMLPFSSICWTNKGSASEGSKEEGKRASSYTSLSLTESTGQVPGIPDHVEPLTASLSSTSLCSLDISDIWSWRIKWIKSSGCLLHRGRGPKWRSYKNLGRLRTAQAGCSDLVKKAEGKMWAEAGPSTRAEAMKAPRFPETKGKPEPPSHPEFTVNSWWVREAWPRVSVWESGWAQDSFNQHS